MLKEQILSEMVQSCSFVNACEKECNTSDQEECYGISAHNVAILFKAQVEKLTVIDDASLQLYIREDVAKSKHSKYRVPITLGPRDNIDRHAQLQHTKNQLSDLMEE